MGLTRMFYFSLTVEFSSKTCMFFFVGLVILNIYIKNNQTTKLIAEINYLLSLTE